MMSKRFQRHWTLFFQLILHADVVTAPTLELVYLYNIVRYSAAAVACGGRAAAAAYYFQPFRWRLQLQPSLAERAGTATAAVPTDIPCPARYSSVLWLVCSDLPDCRGIPGKSPLRKGLQTLADRALPREVTLPRGEGWRGRAGAQLARPTSTQAPPQSQRSTLQIHVRKAGRKRGE